MTFKKMAFASMAVFVLSGFTVMAGSVDDTDVLTQDMYSDDHDGYEYEEGEEIPHGVVSPEYLPKEDPRTEIPLELLELLEQFGQ